MLRPNGMSATVLINGRKVEVASADVMPIPFDAFAVHTIAPHLAELNNLLEMAKEASKDGETV